jgi:hypothetical protein
MSTDPLINPGRAGILLTIQRSVLRVLEVQRTDSIAGIRATRYKMAFCNEFASSIAEEQTPHRGKTINASGVSRLGESGKKAADPITSSLVIRIREEEQRPGVKVLHAELVLQGI